MASTSERYAAASAKFEDSYNKYLGEGGIKLADDYATKSAERMSSSAANNASSSAISSARTAGLNKAQAAMLGNKASADATANTYNAAYDSSRNASLTNNANTVNAATSKFNAEQNEAQNEYDRAWGNTKGGYSAGAGLVGAILSDERVKTFKKVSTRPANTENNYELLKVCYKREK